MEVINKIGRRKESVARIYVKSGNGNITVNKRALDKYFPFELHQIVVKQPLVLVNEDGAYDININVDGGGISGQAEAIRMAISRALCEINEDHRSPLKKEGFLTRDSRMVERKKPGRRKARRRFQFSKR
ncbi:30S ribosomal protein S9 [Cyclobacterium sp. 1_MG-2023]|jgi:small subunit ribosomal protein S9|uniref:Small ribosomal subunit protein uS9 n=2 Tax=Cyclobacterium TaxID=68288 RepID=G0J406_CYCMS|nr:MULTISPECIES: 30S ribosomal protein S9 [Cyclobacterium]MBR9776134.1 30S ribosomal protein S9 [Cytophagales bacterium]AEL26672.1 ribosomal protein S9 [Cyclobacterium marinum DSM 745]AKP52306.1 30S ribosomal protein S9 [Cyclobacterium amurskyense]MBI0400023.1 30S ribosomal protein S9 [Cyclobacterium marinum]MDO6438596.1 30S ribosomal protein S9 [Cyclobacterium sp. 1_MG-2023]|tara:strand:+ start:6589 stop:6975 length:387 start_codon:yes stop_codon:yes gene_type:complete